MRLFLILFISLSTLQLFGQNFITVHEDEDTIPIVKEYFNPVPGYINTQESWKNYRRHHQVMPADSLIDNLTREQYLDWRDGQEILFTEDVFQTGSREWVYTRCWVFKRGDRVSIFYETPSSFIAHTNYWYLARHEVSYLESDHIDFETSVFEGDTTRVNIFYPHEKLKKSKITVRGATGEIIFTHKSSNFIY